MCNEIAGLALGWLGHHKAGEKNEIFPNLREVKVGNIAFHNTKAFWKVCTNNLQV